MLVGYDLLNLTSTIRTKQFVNVFTYLRAYMTHNLFVDFPKWGMVVAVAVVAAGVVGAVLLRQLSKRPKKPSLEDAITAVRAKRRDWRIEIAQVMQKNVESLPVAVDLPRLVGHTTIITPTNPPCTFSGPDAVCDIITVLYEILEGQNAQAIKSEFKSYVLFYPQMHHYHLFVCIELDFELS